MSNMYAIKDTTLTALGDAIRSKNGAFSTVSEMPDEPLASFTMDSSQMEYITETSPYTYCFDYVINLKELLGNTFAHSHYLYVVVDCETNTKGHYSAFVYWRNELTNVSESSNSSLNIREGVVNEERLSIVNNKYKNYAIFRLTTNYSTYQEGSVCKCNIKVYAQNSARNFLQQIKYTPLEMVDALNELNIPLVQPIVLTSDCSYSCAGSIPSKFIELYPDKVTTRNISIASNMFLRYENESIPFDLNFTAGSNNNVSSMFSLAENLKTLPKIYNIKPTDMSNMFSNVKNLREFPEDYFDNFNWSYFTTSTSAYYGNMSSLFKNCYSLRKIPVNIFNNVNPNATYSYTYLMGNFMSCYVLDELADLPLKYTATYTSNAFSSSFSSCSRLKKLTFALEDGQPVKMNCKSQTIDLTTYVGYVNSEFQATGYNSGITLDKKVIDDATYQALKNDEDWFTLKVDYSRYNHDSAVETINSLPDTSAYLATAGGTNTIKFKGAAGALTDGGAINTMTEEEIAVAAAKGWSVSFVN